MASTSPVAMPHFLLSCLYENFTQNSTFFSLIILEKYRILECNIGNIAKS